MSRLQEVISAHPGEDSKTLHARLCWHRQDATMQQKAEGSRRKGSTLPVLRESQHPVKVPIPL